jgi:ribonuclease HI
VQICTSIYVQIARQFSGSLRRLGLYQRISCKCWQALCVLSSENMVTLFWIPGHSGIQGNKNIESVAGKGLNSPFLSSKLAQLLTF